jgi:hypothetical protein
MNIVLKGVIPPNTMTQNVPVIEAVNNNNFGERSEATDVWEAQWNNFGKLPLTFIPKFNMALAEFIVKQTGTKGTFPEVLRQKGGIHSYECFVMVFNHPYPKILKVLGGKVPRDYEKDIVKCIALACFLKLPEFSILGNHQTPEYATFKQSEWIDHLSNHCRTLTNDFRKKLNIHSTYEKNLKNECMRICHLSSKPSSKKRRIKTSSLGEVQRNLIKTPSANQSTSDQSTPRVATDDIPDTPDSTKADKTARNMVDDKAFEEENIEEKELLPHSPHSSNGRKCAPGR